MSHFTRIKTRFASLELLTRALTDLGLSIEVGDLTIRGFGGQKTAVEIKIHTENPDYPIGFVKHDGVYMLVGDYFGLPRFNRQAFLLKLAQQYARQAALQTLNEQDFQLAEEEVRPDGTIHLILRRSTS